MSSGGNNPLQFSVLDGSDRILLLPEFDAEYDRFADGDLALANFIDYRLAYLCELVNTRIDRDLRVGKTLYPVTSGKDGQVVWDYHLGKHKWNYRALGVICGFNKRKCLLLLHLFEERGSKSKSDTQYDEGMATAKGRYNNIQDWL